MIITLSLFACFAFCIEPKHLQVTAEIPTSWPLSLYLKGSQIIQECAWNLQVFNGKPSTYALWQMEDILSLGTEFWGLFTHLCTAVYQPAARVRLMTTSTGIRSATASLLALMVRRIPFPALSQDDIILKLKSCHCNQELWDSRVTCLTYSYKDAAWPVEVVDPTLRHETEKKRKTAMRLNQH